MELLIGIGICAFAAFVSFFMSGLLEKHYIKVFIKESNVVLDTYNTAQKYIKELGSTEIDDIGIVLTYVMLKTKGLNVNFKYIRDCIKEK